MLREVIEFGCMHNDISNKKLLAAVKKKQTMLLLKGEQDGNFGNVGCGKERREEDREED